MMNIENIFFFWGGDISESRLKILQDCVYSTRVFNPTRPIYMVSNSIQEDMLDPKFNIQIYRWDDTLFDDLPIPKDHIEKHYLKAHPRELSDLIRLVLLYKFGGSYIDTDDLAIKALAPIANKNIVCRSYDPHTCHYNKLTPEDCIDGIHREIRGYDHIQMFPRNDCWVNFEPRSLFIQDILSNEKIAGAEKAIYIGDDFSWQSLTLDTCKKHIASIGETYNLALTLMYVYEDFVSASSYWDRCLYGGEMCDLWNEMDGVKDMEWGFYKCSKSTALDYLEKVRSIYPCVSHLWLHSKDMNKDWLLPELTEDKYQVSTWIYQNIKERINEY
jgi:hypothetical protein